MGRWSPPPTTAPRSSASPTSSDSKLDEQRGHRERPFLLATLMPAHVRLLSVLGLREMPLNEDDRSTWFAGGWSRSSSALVGAHVATHGTSDILRRTI